MQTKTENEEEESAVSSVKTKNPQQWWFYVWQIPKRQGPVFLLSRPMKHTTRGRKGMEDSSSHLDYYLSMKCREVSRQDAGVSLGIAKRTTVPALVWLSISR